MIAIRAAIAILQIKSCYNSEYAVRNEIFFVIPFQRGMGECYKVYVRLFRSIVVYDTRGNSELRIKRMAG